jgi:hypothetical protein
MHLDLLTVGVGFFSFSIFLFIHIVFFRWLRPEELLRSLLVCVLAIVLLPVALMGVLFITKSADASLTAWILASVLALCVNGLLCFIYVLCVFGPYETSIRMRLVREIAKGGSMGISFEELTGRYSTKRIMDIRLRRLMGSGDIIEKDGLYKSGRRGNFFFIFDSIAGVIKKWIDQ